MSSIQIKTENGGADEVVFATSLEKLSPYLLLLRSLREEGKYGTPEGFLLLPFDEGHISKVKELAREKKTDALRFVVIVGIGGSNLGTQAVHESVYGRHAILSGENTRVLFADTCNPKEMSSIKQIIFENVREPEEIVINVITKSGSTTETVANFSFLYEFLTERFGNNIKERIVATTDAGSSFSTAMGAKGIKVLEIPENIGGRYSVFSGVGLLPLALLGLDIEELLNGAREGVKEGLLPDTENPAFRGAATIHAAYEKGLRVHNSFFFHSELESLGKWHRQLFAESLGKRFNKNGNDVRAGMLPIVSIGSTDLHSMLQLYLGGPTNIFTNFVYAEKGMSGLAKVPQEPPFSSLPDDIRGKDFSDIMNAIRKGVLASYGENSLPYMETILPALDLYSFGYFMQMKMLETAFLAKLWDINGFDQPEVERYKEITSGLLKNTNI